jgi:hypothetical protein
MLATTPLCSGRTLRKSHEPIDDTRFWVTVSVARRGKGSERRWLRANLDVPVIRSYDVVQIHTRMSPDCRASPRRRGPGIMHGFMRLNSSSECTYALLGVQPRSHRGKWQRHL